MEPRAYAKLDSQILRSRLRNNFNNPGYIRRPIVRTRPELLSDVKQARGLLLTRDTTSSTSTAPNSSAIPSLSHTQELPRVHVINTLSAYDDSKSSTVVPKVSIVAKLKKRLRSTYKSKLQFGLTILAITLILIGGYVSLAGLRANHIAVTQANKLTAQANNAAKSGGQTSALSTVKPSSATVANYVVAPNLPRYLKIPRLGVDARVFSVGVNASGALATPNNIYDTDWYNESAEPGQPGAMLIDGHISSWTAHGVFYGLKDLVAGDVLQIVRGDRTVFTYKVVKAVVYPSGNVNMTSAMTSVVNGTPGLNLISCDGDVIPGTNLFNERIVVFSEQINP
ncbi:MAG TPA: class F sortase [Candidatus Saccharimonadales bacterium]